MLELSEIQRVFQAQRAHRRTMRHTTAAERIARLERLRAEVLARQEAIGLAAYADLGRPADNRFEVNTLAGNIDKVRDELEEWMKPLPIEKSPSSPPAEAIYVKYEPRGVVLLFSTWNMPLTMFFSPLVQAIAAGNVVIGKTNPLAPATGKIIAEIVRAVFDEREVAVVDDDEVATPDGVATANDVLLDLPVDHIFLTGSTRVGKIIIERAAKHMTSFTLELGGKSPVIVDRTIDLDYVATNLVAGKFKNQGQTCLSVDYVWVPEDLRDALVEKYVAALRDAHYEGGQCQWQRDGRFVNRVHFDRVRGYLDDAVARGAKVAFGGAVDADNLVIEPAVLVDVPLDAQVMQEEIFGPVLPFLTYADEEEIFAHADTLGKPLGFYIYSMDPAFIQRVLDNTSSGGVSINRHNAHWGEENLPFGGVNSSGFGHYHGIWGFRELSNARSVYHVAVD